ncbi:elongation factor G-like protein EF-G2 [Actinoalloteichus spitiensis]|uniref:elongation factor G-like protein EF-G2 n=1 Tax=Actinoalloteichus spitiensis TaxID=252394 RepID=UPI000474A6B2|nr:elongation factor G-like protein EF-G2 [Actinoalloteichus spitiensis]
MAHRRSDEGRRPATPLVDTTRIRDVALLGPSGGGKTTLVEALLAATGTIPRAGSVDEGTAVTDQDAAARHQRRSVALAVAPVRHRDTHVNLVDTPGYPDYIGQVRAGLRATDAALFVVGAHGGVDEATVRLWRECVRTGTPRAVVITQLDHRRADPERVLVECARAFGPGILPLYLPVTASNGETTGLHPVLDHGADPWGGRIGLRDPAMAHRELVEAVIAESEDDALLETYLRGASPREDQLLDDLARAVLTGDLHPVLPVAATEGVGLTELLDLVTRVLPSPAERECPPVTGADGAPERVPLGDPDGPLLAEVVGSFANTYLGPVTLLRTFSGSLRADDRVRVAGHGLEGAGRPEHAVVERVGRIHSPLGMELRETGLCVAGDICAVTKLAGAETGDTVSTPERPLVISPWTLPEPLLPIAVTAADPSAEDLLGRNLSRMAATDPGVRIEQHEDTHQLVLWCTGEGHADLVLTRLGAGEVDLRVEPVRVPLRQTFAGPARGHGRHVKQTGGHGQYAVCDIEVEPLPRGGGFDFEDLTVGGSVPRQFVPSVERGIRALMARGLTEGVPLVDVRVTLLDGRAHSVDSSDAAFQTAGALALRDAASKVALPLLEPVDEVAIHTPDDCLGPVLGDLAARRAQVLGTEPAPEAGWTLVWAEVPEAELSRYLVELNQLTSGRADFHRVFAGYEARDD